MSRGADIDLDFGGEERTFRLGIGQWRKVQERCDAGPAELLARLSPVFTAKRAGLTVEQIMTHGLLGTWRVDDVREPILQGLLGANMALPEATKIVREWVDERPLLEAVEIAYMVVLASVIGTEDEKAMGESQAAGDLNSQTSHAASSDSAKMGSTPKARPSAGTPEPLTP